MLKAFNFPLSGSLLLIPVLRGWTIPLSLTATRLIPSSLLEVLDKRDPLSPYLFILAMEYLSIMISDSVNSGDWKPFRLRKHDLQMSHLLFVDGVLLLAEDYSYTIDNINYIIDTFYKTSGMQINLEKSKLWLSPLIHEDMKMIISNSLRINASGSLGTYLAFTLKPKYSSSDFNFVAHKIH